MRVLRRISRFIIPVIILVLSLSIINSTINRHNHMVSGYIYSHAHPYQTESGASPFQKHNHSALELAILDLLSDLQLILFTLAAALALLPVISRVLATVITSPPSIRRMSTLIPRAPPVYSY